MASAKELIDKVYETITTYARQHNPTWEGAITADESAKGQVELYDRLTIADTGRFVTRDGKDIEEL